MSDAPTPKPSSLQEFVLYRLAELGTPGSPLSMRDAAAKSDGAVSHPTIAKIVNGKHRGRLSPRVAEGLAAALQVPVGQVYDAAGQPRAAGAWRLPDRFSQLSQAQRDIVEALCEALLTAHTDGFRQGQREIRSNVVELRNQGGNDHRK